MLRALAMNVEPDLDAINIDFSHRLLSLEW